MPAIDLIRLRTRIALLNKTFAQPADFVAGLREIYSIYSDRTFPLASYHLEIHSQPAFNTPPLLNRELESALIGYCTSQPEQLMQILELLWHQPEIEMRQLAAVLLGKYPVAAKEMVISHIVEWSSNPNDALLLPYLHEYGSETLRKVDPQTWLAVLEKWRDSHEIWQVKLSIQGLITLIDDQQFENLPAIYTFLSPLFSSLTVDLQYDLQIALEHLARRSEVETVYFLKQIIARSKNPAFGRFIRRALDIFSPGAQLSLKNYLRSNENLNK